MPGKINPWWYFLLYLKFCYIGNHVWYIYSENQVFGHVSVGNAMVSCGIWIKMHKWVFQRPSKPWYYWLMRSIQIKVFVTIKFALDLDFVYFNSLRKASLLRAGFKNSTPKFRCFPRYLNFLNNYAVHHLHSLPNGKCGNLSKPLAAIYFFRKTMVFIIIFP